jgi:hypothetical protein
VKNCSPVDLELQYNDFIGSIENVQDWPGRSTRPTSKPWPNNERPPNLKTH